MCQTKAVDGHELCQFPRQTSKERHRGALSWNVYEEKEEGEILSEAQRVNVKVGKVGTKHKWKPPV